MNAMQGAALMSVTRQIPLATAFLQGLLSFFSPCVLPLLPVYLSTLAGGARTVGPDGAPVWQRRTTLINTCFFVLGISTALILLGAAFTSLGQFFRRHQTWVNLICGLTVILFGLLQLGLGGHGSALRREYRLPLRLDKLRMNPAAAWLMGFCFSFSWTPCVGPTLTGVLMTVAASSTRGRGILLMGGYILGFVLPFLAAGLFTGSVLSFFRKHRGVVRWSSVVSGVLLILVGVLIMTGSMSSLSNWIASASAEEAEEAEAAADLAPDFTLTDQYGTEHTLSDYQGKVVFLNFWTTWCPWCVKEMPDIETLYLEMGENQGDVVILGVGSPGVYDDTDEQGIMDFLSEQEITYPTLMDTTGEVFNTYGATSLPTTWLIRADGKLMGYVPGAMEKETMLDVIQQTLGAGSSD